MRVPHTTRVLRLRRQGTPLTQRFPRLCPPPALGSDTGLSEKPVKTLPGLSVRPSGMSQTHLPLASESVHLAPLPFSDLLFWSRSTYLNLAPHNQVRCHSTTSFKLFGAVRMTRLAQESHCPKPSYMGDLWAFNVHFPTFQPTSMSHEQCVKCEGECENVKAAHTHIRDSRGDIVFIGTLKGTSMYGQNCVLYSADRNHRYTGEVVNGLPHSQSGKLFDVSTGVLIYEGPWVKGELHGPNIKVFHSNGNVKFEGSMNRGKLFGDMCKVYHACGSLAYTGPLQSGRKHGWGCTEYYRPDLTLSSPEDATGANQPRLVGEALAGEWVGPVEMFARGGWLLASLTYGSSPSEGLVHAEQVDAETGHVVRSGAGFDFETALIIGSNCTMYDSETGRKVYEGDLSPGGPEGNGTLYCKESGLQTYKGGLSLLGPHGFGVEYDPAGNCIFEGEFKDGKRNGPGTEFDERGNAAFKGSYKNGLRDGFGVSGVYNQKKHDEIEAGYNAKVLAAKKKVEDGIATYKVKEAGEDAESRLVSGTAHTDQFSPQIRQRMRRVPFDPTQVNIEKPCPCTLSCEALSSSALVVEVLSSLQTKIDAVQTFLEGLNPMPTGAGSYWEIYRAFAKASQSGALKLVEPFPLWGLTELGMWREGKLHGPCLELDETSRPRYLGFMHEGARTGFGFRTAPGLFHLFNVFIGVHKDGELNGPGVEVRDGKQYRKGCFKAGLLHGEGATCIGGKVTYQGQFRADKRYGKGTEYLSTGVKIYEGTWVDGVREGEEGCKEFDGKGRFVFEGGFKAGKKEGGSCVEYDPVTGRVLYRGGYKGGLRHGSGCTLYNAQTGDVVYAGEFAEGKQTGLDLKNLMLKLLADLPNNLIDKIGTAMKNGANGLDALAEGLNELRSTKTESDTEAF